MSLDTFKMQLAYIMPSSLINVAIPILGSFFIALMAQIAVPIPFSPIPMTMQTFAIFTMAGVLGSRRAFQSVCAYLIEGTFGLPVFAGALVNPLWIISPRGGYLIGFAVATLVIGMLLERRKTWSFFYIMMSIIAGQIILYSFGVLWLTNFFGLVDAIAIGVIPFLPSAAIKLFAATTFLKGYNLTLNK